MTNSKFKFGSVVLVRFPFTDLENSKQRPCLVLNQIPYSKNLSLNTVVMITSQIDAPEIQGDFELEDWSSSGLLHPSRVRLAKIATIEDQLILKTLGNLSAGDLKKLKVEFRKLFDELI